MEGVADQIAQCRIFGAVGVVVPPDVRVKGTAEIAAGRLDGGDFEARRRLPGAGQNELAVHGRRKNEQSERGEQSSEADHHQAPLRSDCHSRRGNRRFAHIGCTSHFKKKRTAPKDGQRLLRYITNATRSSSFWMQSSEQVMLSSRMAASRASVGSTP